MMDYRGQLKTTQQKAEGTRETITKTSGCVRPEWVNKCPTP